MIPGARNPEQARGNVAAADAAAAAPPTSSTAVRDVYDRLIRPHVHDRW